MNNEYHEEALSTPNPSKYSNTIFLVPPGAEMPPGFPFSVERAPSPSRLLEIIQTEGLMVVELTAEQLEWLTHTKRMLWPSYGEQPVEPRHMVVLRGVEGDFGGSWGMGAHAYDTVDAMELLATRADARQEARLGVTADRSGRKPRLAPSFKQSLKGMAAPAKREDDETEPLHEEV